ncbi:hypothetical protein EVG20_g10654 [Dentipellis fragilis]|uniref:Uncharacterized protein n=1 Tax=Dentipellis fragilis TaxID=205917 RepID=A0A4Y9XR06_9AGAM|nr:hypothetical protein EVG20_g10654 [Dentipellis fragilis]
MPILLDDTAHGAILPSLQLPAQSPLCGPSLRLASTMYEAQRSPASRAQSLGHPESPFNLGTSGMPALSPDETSAAPEHACIRARALIKREDIADLFKPYGGSGALVEQLLNPGHDTKFSAQAQCGITVYEGTKISDKIAPVIMAHFVEHRLQNASFFVIDNTQGAAGRLGHQSKSLHRRRLQDALELHSGPPVTGDRRLLAARTRLNDFRLNDLPRRTDTQHTYTLRAGKMSTPSGKSKATMLGSTYMTINGKRRKLITRKRLRKYSWLPDVFRIKNSVCPHSSLPPSIRPSIFLRGASVDGHLPRVPGGLCGVEGEELDVDELGDALVGGRRELWHLVTPPHALSTLSVCRNGTSYDRYYEGRKSFGALTSHVRIAPLTTPPQSPSNPAQIRNVSRLIWINVALPPTDDAPSSAKGKTPTTSITAAQLRRAKTDALKLCLAFAYSVKHYLREEDGLGWDDYADVLPRAFARAHEARAYRAISDATQSSSPVQASSGLPSRVATPDPELGKVNRGLALSIDVEAPEEASPSPAATKRVRVKRSVDKLHGTKTPLLSADHRTVNFDQFAETTIPLPLVIAHEINLKLFKFRRDGFLETVGPAGMNSMSQGIQGMVDQMTNLERIANTPIPKSYGIHLKQCVTLYLFCLPFTLLKELGWSMIPVVTVIAFTFMGIEGIAEEIEMPFGYDGADLPLDRYCFDLKEEVEYIIDRLPEGGFGGYGYDDGEGDD